MIELFNSKQTYLGKAPDGRNRFALDCSIGAMQMLLDGKRVDIQPRLVREGDTVRVEGTPYDATVDLITGTRQIWPDRTDHSKWLKLPGIALFQRLPKRVVGNQIIMSAPKFDIILSFGKTRASFSVLIKDAVAFDRLTRSRIVLNMDSAGLDIGQLLKAKTGLGIPRPRLIEQRDDPEAKERWLDWGLKAGQLELGFDLSGLKFPVLLRNTTLDLQVDATTDDGQASNGDTDYYSSASAYVAVGAGSYENRNHQSWSLFGGLSGLSGVTIDVAYISVNGHAADSGTPLTKIYADDQASPTYTTTVADYLGRTRTTAGVDWDSPGLSVDGWANSPSIVAVIQELATSYDPTAIQILHDDDGSSHAANNFMQYHQWDESGNVSGTKLHIEYTAAPAGWAGGDVCGVAIAAIAKINGVSLADIVRVNGVS